MLSFCEPSAHPRSQLWFRTYTSRKSMICGAALSAVAVCSSQNVHAFSAELIPSISKLQPVRESSSPSQEQHIAVAPVLLQTSRCSSLVGSTVTLTFSAFAIVKTRQRHRCKCQAVTKTKPDTEIKPVQTTAKKKTSDPRETLAKIPDDFDWDKVSDEWEVDCFSRPVVKGGKKMWELLVTDKNAVYRRVAQMKPTRVNSLVVTKLLTVFIQESKVKPRVIRFYRKVMKNMLNVALSSIKEDIPELQYMDALPSRNCHVMRRWINYRERAVYPTMDGYIPQAGKALTAPSSSSQVKMHREKLPDRFKFPRYVFASVPWEVLQMVKPGSMPGEFCTVAQGMPADTKVHGVVLLSTRAAALCAQFRGLELCGMRVDLETNDLLMDIGLEQTYQVTQVPVEDRDTCTAFERSKKQLGGLHFIAVHNALTGGNLQLPTSIHDMGGEGSITGLWLCMDYSSEDTN